MLGTDLQQELFKTLGVAVVAVLYASAGESFSTGGTVIIALSVVQVISLANLLFALPPRKGIEKVEETVNGGVSGGMVAVAGAVLSCMYTHMQCLALFLVPLLCVKVLIPSSLISSSLPVALVACAVGAAHSLLQPRTEQTSSHTSPFDVEFWTNVDQVPEQNAEVILAEVAQIMEFQPEFEKKMEEQSRQAWEEHVNRQGREAYLQGEEEQWDNMMSLDDA